jgi:SsrA-binding protein
MPKETGRKQIASNRRARHDYTILDTFEAGIVLAGTEVKSLREGRANMADSFGMVSRGEVFLHNVHIPEYKQGSWTNHEPRRTRKLLLHAREIDKIGHEMRDDGLAIKRSGAKLAGAARACNHRVSRAARPAQIGTFRRGLSRGTIATTTGSCRCRAWRSADVKLS